MNFKEEAISIKDELINLRRWFHMNPELGYEEFETSKFIKEYLSMQGIEYEEFGKTGVCGIINGKKKGTNKVIGLRADIDALPIEEKNVCSYTSQIYGRMHACGHDGHMTILLGAAKILNNNKEKFSGTIKLIFEPAEETTGGAKLMISEGVLKNPKVDVISGLHMDEGLDCGSIKVKKGTVNAASNPFNITIKGAGGHGAYPAETIDPIVIASHIVMAIQTIVSREVDPLNPAVITIGSINGGTAPNIIPEEVKLSGIIRTMTKNDRKFVVDRLTQIVEGISISSRANVKIDIEESYPSLSNDDGMVEILENSARKILDRNNVKLQEKPKMGVESFAYFANEVPAVFYFLGCRNEKKGIIYPAHNSLFDIDEDSLPIGVAIQCQIAIDYLTSEQNNINLI